MSACLSYFERLSRLMEGKIDLSARRHVTNRRRDAYGKASKADKGRILDKVQAATGVARSTGGSPRSRASGDSARELLAHLWQLMGPRAGLLRGDASGVASAAPGGRGSRPPVRNPWGDR